MFYFGYGSNLSSVEWKAFCNSEEYVLSPVCAAWLPDHELVFNRRSQRWGGGALSITPRLGQLVPGYLFDIDERCLGKLDKKEGCPDYYEQIEKPVLLDDGTKVIAITYRVREDQKAVEGFVSPTPPYVGTVRNGQKERDICCKQLEGVVTNSAAEFETDALFVYGTLLRGEVRSPVISDLQPQCVLLAEIPGSLFDLGAYPGLLFAGGGELVQGEFIRFCNIGEAFKVLDEIEGFQGWEQQGSLFERRLVQVGLRDGRVRLAWTYVWLGDSQSAKQITCGDWREHQGRIAKFLEVLVRKHTGGEEEKTAAILAQSPFLAPENLEGVTKSLLPLAAALRAGRISERELAQVSGQWAVHVGEMEVEKGRAL